MGKYYKLSILKADGNGFVAEARGNIDNDATEDIWQIDESGRLENTVDDVTK